MCASVISVVLSMCLTSFTDNVKGTDTKADSYNASTEVWYDYNTSTGWEFDKTSSLPIFNKEHNSFPIHTRQIPQAQYVFTTTDFPEINTDDLMDRISNLTNDVQRDIVSNQLRYCPYTDLCTISSLLSFDYTHYANKGPCCQRCSCDRKTCFIYQTCCPDIMQYPAREMLHDNNKQLMEIMGKIAEDGQAKRSCLSLGFKSKCMILGIVSCPDPTSGYSFQCIREYTSNIDLLIDIVPCYGKARVDFYRNRFCAYCNGLSDEDIVFFEPVLACNENPSIEEISDVRQILSLVLVGGASSRQPCDMLFRKSTNITASYCTPTHNRCNMTGLWTTYSLEIEMACLSYSSKIMYMNTLFENMYCVICNGYSVETVEPLCDEWSMSDSSGDPSPFTGLLKLETTGVEIGTNIICSHNEFYDDQKVNTIYISTCERFVYP